MAEFKDCFNKLIMKEGEYVNDPDDAGGETYKGISRVSHPDSLIWIKVDDIKNFGNVTNKKDFNKILNQDEDIQKEIEKIYKEEYWDKIRLSELISTRLACQIFNMAVNSGIKNAIKLAERTVGMKETGEISDELIKKLNGN